MRGEKTTKPITKTRNKEPALWTAGKNTKIDFINPNTKAFTLLNKKLSLCLQIIPLHRSYPNMWSITGPIQQGKNVK